MTNLRKCRIDGCDKRHYSKELCQVHYKRLKKYGDPLFEPPVKRCANDECNNKVITSKYCSTCKRNTNRLDPNFPRCFVFGCEEPKGARSGLCQKHEARRLSGKDIVASTNQDPRKTVLIGDMAILPIGKDNKDGFAVVDRDMSWVDNYQWSTHGGYPKANCSVGKNIMLHHLIMGFPINGLVVDHKNGDTRDNRRSNLRIVKEITNFRNHKLFSTNKTGFKGVSEHNGKYRACIVANYKQYSKSGFETPEEA